MGDRVSIQFKNGNRKSVAFFSHWRGKEFAKEALRYAEELAEEKEGESCYPLDRLEPETVLVDFIRETTKDEARIQSDLYLGKDGNDGDNSDNGNYIIDLQTLKMRKEKRVDD